MEKKQSTEAESDVAGNKTDSVVEESKAGSEAVIP